MVKTHKNIKEIAYKTLLGGLFLLNVATTSLAQEGTIDDKVNGEMSNQPGISDQIEKTEQPDLKEISDQINFNVDKYLENRLEIGGISAYKEIIKGHEIYYFEGLDCAFLKLKLGKNIPSILTASVNYAIKEGYEEVKSLIKYDSECMKIYMDIFKKTIETKGEDTYVYVPTNIENIKNVKNINSSINYTEE